MARTIGGCSADSAVSFMSMVTAMAYGFLIAGFATLKRIIPMNITSKIQAKRSQKRCNDSIESGTTFLRRNWLLPRDLSGQENNSGSTTLLKPKSSQTHYWEMAGHVPMRYSVRWLLKQ
jgi:hypothetical protein